MGGPVGSSDRDQTAVQIDEGRMALAVAAVLAGLVGAGWGRTRLSAEVQATTCFGQEATIVGTDGA
jgi:hypothetical protein